jgi:hypothetical protein
MHSQLSLQPISHLNKGMIWFVPQYLDSYYVSIQGKQIEKLILINFLQRTWNDPGSEF